MVSETMIDGSWEKPGAMFKVSRRGRGREEPGEVRAF
jgi:hypothetical protein